MCNTERILCTENPNQNEDKLNVNSAAVLGFVSAGLGHSAMNEINANLDLPPMSYRQYSKHHEIISDVILQTAWSSMEEAGKEEAELAKEVGDIDDDGIPTITVIADGAWSKRSYKVNYDALSGVACIVGARTGKLLFVGIRNKYCSICDRCSSKNIPSPAHSCCKNWTGSSTAMESDIIVEGFQQSISMHGLKYTQLVGDGDSSVLKKLCIAKPYGHKVSIKKIECVNHLLRNYCSKLREVCKQRYSSKKKLVVPYLRTTLGNNIMRLRIGIKKAILYRRSQTLSLEQQVELLSKDIANCPKHVFGQHESCDSYFCQGNKEGEVNIVPDMIECGLFDDIESSGKRLVQNVHSLILNMKNNAAETYNSIVCKFVGGKRINFSVKNSYEVRCKAAAICYNKKEEYLALLHKNLTGRSPGQFAKKYIARVKRKREYNKIRKELFPRLKKRKTAAPPDENYGRTEIHEFEKKRDELLEYLSKTEDEIKDIEINTRGQSSNSRWKQERSSRLTASNFGAVCKLKSTTDPSKLAKNIVCSEFRNSAAIKWGIEHEATAKLQFENDYEDLVSDCGLFIDKENCFLGASPDGIIDPHHIVEIKCPWSIRDLSPQQAVNEKKIKYLKIDQNGDVRLKENHNYYFQVQGQLAITGANYCYFVVWTPSGLIVDKIEKNISFWENNVPKLKDFYLNVMAREILKNS
ncbi:hypothetical protein RI129_011380 [Pyrocoelia pectoralis]|uniref:YqaJ viral recombinase domain-containing protein n=1 Tax=Pyrocoelia pectoralis TaxID=417401 RepID=A0AAN7V670_9COLE